MKKLILTCLTIPLLFVSCINQDKDSSTTQSTQTEEIKPDTYFQYSIWWAFVNRVFDGDLKVSTMKENGDIGLGSFDFMDGEMVMLDGIAYRIREDGVVSVGADDDEIVYANAAFFDEDGSFQIEETTDFTKFKDAVDASLPSHNYFYAFKSHGTFKTLKLGGVPKQEKPFVDGLDVLLPIRPIFEGENITGTLVGFYCPDFIGNINVAGFHFHFISDDLKMGGHTLEFESEGALEVIYDKMNNYHFYLPDNEDFENVQMESEFQYNK